MSPPDSRPRARDLLGAAALLVGLGLALSPRPSTDNSVEALLRSDDEAAATYRRFQSRFGTDEVFVVQLQHPRLDALLTAESEFSKALRDSRIIEAVLSPSEAYASEVELLLDPDLGGVSEADRLAPRFAGPLGRQLGLLSLDQPRARIFALSRVSDVVVRDVLATRLAQLRTELQERGGSAQIAGSPLLNLALDRAGRDVERRALPLLLAVSLALLLLVLRSLRLTLLVMVPVSLGVLGTEGALGWAGVETNLIINIAKPLLFVLLLATALHVTLAFVRHARDAAPQVAADRAVQQKGRAARLALLTTAIGFGSLGISAVPPIRVFGIMTAIGLLFGIPLCLALLPGLLARFGRSPQDTTEARAPWAVHLVRTGASYPVLWAVIGIAVLGVGAFAATQLRTDPHAIRYFSEDHALRLDHERLEADGMGLSTLEVVVTSTQPLNRGAGLRQLDGFATAIAQAPGVRAAISWPLFVKEAQYRANGLEGLAMVDVLTSSTPAQRGADSGFISEDGLHARVSLMIATLDADQVEALQDSIAAARPRFFPNARVETTGNYGLLIGAQRGLLDTLKWSLLITALLMELVLLIVVRSPKLALIALIPNLFPIAVNFVIMWLLGIPLDLGTAMTAAIALGIAVDDTLHFLLSVRNDGLLPAARSTGRTLVFSSLVIGAGFLVLMTTSFSPTKNFGLLAGAAMGTALFADLVILPALLVLVGAARAK